MMPKKAKYTETQNHYTYTMQSQENRMAKIIDRTIKSIIQHANILSHMVKNGNIKCE